MSLSEKIERMRSGVFKLFFPTNDPNIPPLSGTGFMMNGYMITNFHVYDFINSEHSDQTVVFCPYDSKGKVVGDRIEIPKNIRINKNDIHLVTSSSENSYDFAILEIPTFPKNGIYNFDCEGNYEAKPGDDIAFLGYPLSSFNLSCHKGIISSQHISGTSQTEVLQIDASVNNGNSGGPLFCPTSGKVLGIITRKETGLTGAFSSLKTLLQNQITDCDNIAKGGGAAILMGINFVEFVKAISKQLLHLTNELERSANVGIGHAFSIKHIKEALSSL